MDCAKNNKNALIPGHCFVTCVCNFWSLCFVVCIELISCAFLFIFGTRSDSSGQECLYAVDSVATSDDVTVVPEMMADQITPTLRPLANSTSLSLI